MSAELEALAKVTEKVAKWGRTSDDYLSLLVAAEKAIAAGAPADGEPVSKAREALAALLKKQPKAGDKTCWLPDDPFVTSDVRGALDKVHAAMSAAEKDWQRWKNADNAAQAVETVRSALGDLGPAASHPAAARIAEKMAAVSAELGIAAPSSSASSADASASPSAAPVTARAAEKAAASEAARAAAALGKYFEDDSRLLQAALSTNAINTKLFERSEPGEVEADCRTLDELTKTLLPQAEEDLRSALDALGVPVEDVRKKAKALVDLVDDNDLIEALEIAHYRTARLSTLRGRLEELGRAALDSLAGRAESYLASGALAQAREAASALARTAPDDGRGSAFIASIDEADSESSAERERATDAAEWPREFSAFAGPGDPKELAASALTWLDSRGTPDGKPCRHLAATVAGDWWSVKTDPLGRTIQWALPLNVAIRKDHGRWKDKDVVIVFNMSVLTDEREGVEKAPPWVGTAVGDSFEMRLSRLQARTG